MPAENPEAGWDAFDGSDPDITAEFWGPDPSQRRRMMPGGARWSGALIGSLRTSPFLRRLGLLAVVGLLLVPVALAVRAPRSPSPAVLAMEMATGSSAPDAAVVIVSLAPQAPGAGDASAAATGATSDASADAGADVADAAGAGDATGSVRMMSLPILNTPEELAATERRAACGGSYTVRAGDSWLRIARSGQMDVEDLLAINEARLTDAIHPGRELCIPRGARMPSPPVTTTTTTTTPRRTPPPTPPSTQPPTAGAGAASTARNSAPTPRPPTSEVLAMIREVWPSELHERAIAIAHRESRYRADAYNGWCCYGVFQIHWNAHRSWLRDHGITSARQLLDARTNIEMAYRIYQRAGGWGPWRL